ncbi:protein ELYS [Sipha flava]|uniref:Protein ELYS n=1 Tax=Sipha flava TaxID=143950 RepID=A0A8B8FDI6_9HEMI|nr:protein ELYS [Sipha flava]XP_025408949.1 protein ELYS [Sipha flava]
MSALKPVLQVIESHPISNQLFQPDSDKFGGLITNSQYAWFTNGADITLYSKQFGSIVSSKSFAINQKDKSLKITFVKELSNCEETYNFILVGCSFKSSGILFICQLPTLTTIRCIELPNAISYISTINNKPLAENLLCDEFSVMSTVLLVGLATGAAYAIDLRQNHIEQQLRRNEIVVNESRPSKIFIVRKNEDCQEVKEMSDDSDSHLAMFINENFYAYCKKQYNGKLNLNVSSLLYIEEINTIAIGYSTGHYQLWDCKIMRTICLLKEPKCVMPVTHISFMEPSDDPNNLCYLWVIQSDNSKLPNATMIALTYEERIVMPNGHLLYKTYKGSGVKLEMSLKKETGIGRCISALSLCNMNLFRNETDIDEDCEIRLFAMLIEIRKNVDADQESYIFLFDINQWYKAQMPSYINHLQVSNSYASFVKLPHNVSCLDFKISDRTLRPFGYNFRSNVEELYYPSSIYFECDCLMNSEIIQFKHAGVQQEILDQLLLKNWKLLTNPSLVFSQCLQTNLRPFFWDNPEDYVNYSLLDKRSFIISILVENKILSVLSACAEEWKNGTYVSTGATILHLVQCLWKHVMVVKQFADKLCVPLFDYSGTQLDKKNKRILNHCLSQMECVKNFLKDLHTIYGVHIINVDYSFRVYTLNLVTQYFKAVTCFLNYGLLPESTEEDPTQGILHCDFTSLIQYANKRRMEFGDSQLYLIDAIVYNEPKGNKLIEQWQHEGSEATKGMYPPSTVQCLLRIYLNSALSDQVKDFIIIYFLIDVCSSQELNVMLANRMCNFAIEFDVENKGLNTLCRASWLFDHDMFEDAIEILSNNKEWMIDNDKSWDWFHWTVLKLLVFKTEYFWARFYMKLVNIKPENINDHKFYINLQVLNNQYFDGLNYIRSRPIKEKQILFEYFFDRCRETSKLKCLIEYLWELEEEELFYSYLKKFNDPESLSIQLLFLLQRGRYIEAIELNKSLECINKSKCNDGLAITSLLVSGFDKSIPMTMKQNYNRPPVKSLYKKTDIVTKCMNNDIKLFNVTERKTDNVVNLINSPKSSSNSINLIIPPNNSTRKRSPSYDILYNEKRRKITDDYILSPPKVVDDVIERPIEKHVLEILKTPLVEKTFTSPSVMNYSSILKTGSAKNLRILSLKGAEKPASKTILRFSLPDDNNTSIEQVESEKMMDISKPDIDKNDDIFIVESSDSNNSSHQIIKESIDLPNDNSKKESLDFETVVDERDDECEQMDISEVYSLIDLETQDTSLKKRDLIPSDTEVNTIFLLSSSDEDEVKVTSDPQSVTENTNSITYKYNEYDDQIEYKKITSSAPSAFDIKNYSLATNTEPVMNVVQKSISHSNDVNSNFRCSYLVGDQHLVEEDDDDVIILDSENEDEIEKEFSPACSSGSTETIKTLDCSSESNSSCDSDLENTRYGRFKSHKEEKIQDNNDDQLEEEGEEEEGEEEEFEEEEGEEGFEEIENDVDSCGISFSGEENNQKEEMNSEQYDVISSMGVNYGYLQSCHEGNNIDTDENHYNEYDVDEPRLQYSKESSGTNLEHHLENYDDHIMYIHPNECEENNFENHNIEFDNKFEENDNAEFDEEVEEISSENEKVEDINSENDNVEIDDEVEEICSEDDIVEFNEKVEKKCSVEFNQEVEEIGSENDNVDIDEEVEDMNSENEKFEEIGSENEEVEEICSENDIVESNEEVEEIGSENDNIEIDEEVEDLNSENEKVEEIDSKYEEVEICSEDDIIEFNEEVDKKCSVEFNQEVEEIGSENNNLEIDEEVEEIDSENEEVEEICSENDIVEFNEEVDRKYSVEFNQEDVEIGSENVNVKFDEQYEDNSLEKHNLKDIGNTLIQFNDKFNVALEKDVFDVHKKEESENDIIITSSDGLNSNMLKNTSSAFDPTKEIPSNDIEIDDITKENYSNILVENEIVGNSSIKGQENINETVEHINDITNCDVSIKVKNNNDEILTEVQNDMNTAVEECPSAINDNNIEESITKSSLIPENCPNHTTMTETQLSQLGSFEVDVNQSTPFLFGDSFSGQQDFTDHKPMFLFGQVYSFNKEQFIVTPHTDTPTTQDLNTNNDEIMVTNIEPKNVEVVDDIQDILELESLPESNPDENLVVHKRSRLNSLQPDSNENNETINIIDQFSVPSDNNSLLQNDIIQDSETKKPISTINTNLLMKSDQLESTINHESQILPIMTEKRKCETDHLADYSVENNKKEEKFTEKSLIVSHNTEDMKTTPKPRRSVRAISEQKESNMTIMTRSKRAKSLIPHSTTENLQIYNSNNPLLELNNTFNLPKSEQSCDKIPIESINPYVVLIPLSDTIITTNKMVKNKEIEPLPDKTDKMEDIGDLNSSRRTSLRSSVIRTKRYSTVSCDDSEYKTKQPQSSEVEENQLSVSMSNVNEKINNETNSSRKRRRSTKSSQLPETEIIKRRTRAKSETNLNQSIAGSLNLFRASEMLEDDTRHVTVSLSRKKSKSQGNIVSTKQESGCSKSSIPVKPAFALELIPEEDFLNHNKNVESEHVSTRKSKFNFLANKSNRIEPNDTNVQLKTKAKTPKRRAKSVESGPAITLSAVKPKRPKRSASVNLLLSDEENEENDRMETYKKAIQVKQKRSTSKFVNSRKKPKISHQNESIYISESETDSNESNQNLNELFTPANKNTKIPMGVLNSENDDSSDDNSAIVFKQMLTSKTFQSSCSVEPIVYRNKKNEHKSSVETVVSNSPIAVKEKKKPKADISKQRKTSSSNTTEIQNSPKKTVKSNTEKTYVDELPKRRRRNIKETIQAPIDPLNDPLSERRMTRSQHLLLDKSLQSTSLIVHDETANNLSAHKPENKKTPKKIKQKKSNN